MVPGSEFLARRICDLMTGYVPTINTITFDGYLHCAAIMINGLLEEKVNQILYLAKGKKGPATVADCRHVRANCFGFAPIFLSLVHTHVFTYSVL